MSAFILSISTATDITSVALHEAGELISEQVCHKSRSAGESLPGMVRELFKKSGCSPEQLRGVAITSGPGSYTGLRIGTAFAKGLCYAQNIPLLPINTLVVLGHSAKCFPIPEKNTFVCAIGCPSVACLCSVDGRTRRHHPRSSPMPHERPETGGNTWL